MANEKLLIEGFKNEVMNKFIELCRGNDFNKLTLLRIGETIDRIYEKYSTLPTVDAVPVVHGEWDVIEDDYCGMIALKCSECNEEFWFEEEVSPERYHYCPNCGAKMRLEGDA